MANNDACMNVVSMDATELNAHLENMLNVRDEAIMLQGKHGIGKSEIIETFYKEHGFEVVKLFLGQMADPGDIIGLPYFDEEAHCVRHSKPVFLCSKSNKPIALFLDEFNRARPELHQVAMDLVLNHKLGEHELPEGSVVAAAINGGAEYNVEELDPAMVSRFSIVDFQPSSDDWLNWGAKQGLDTRVLDFIRQSRSLLEGADGNTAGIGKSPDRRAWTKVARLIKGKEVDNLLIKSIATIVGVSAAAGFRSWLEENHLPSGEDVLTKWTPEMEKKLRTLALHELSNISGSIMQYLNTYTVGESKKLDKAVKTAFENYVKMLVSFKKDAEAGKEAGSAEPIYDLVSYFVNNDQYLKAFGVVNTLSPKASELILENV